ncbi:MAG: efflux RND transporter periplasmic adaptor subunit [Opitutaceae bacterium]
MVQARTLPLDDAFPGRIAPVRIAQVLARVTGIVLHREFRQGSLVKAGQVLYRIDPAPYQAALDSAAASVAQAQAMLTEAGLLAKRYKPLLAIHSVSRQSYDNAVAAADQAKAGVQTARAALETARLNLGYCTVTAPISGRIGQALVTEGALVSQSAATQMAVIQQTDPIYFDFTQAAADVVRLRMELASGRLKLPAPGEAELTLALPDGTAYPHPGRLLFADITVDQTSGMITLRAEFPNPEGWLLPGMFAVGRLAQAVEPNTLLVPQSAVMIEPDGSASVYVVGAANQVRLQPVRIGEAVGNQWIVESGLAAGDRVVVAGLQKVRPGLKVEPTAANMDQPVGGAAAGA